MGCEAPALSAAAEVHDGWVRTVEHQLLTMHIIITGSDDFRGFSYGTRRLVPLVGSGGPIQGAAWPLARLNHRGDRGQGIPWCLWDAKTGVRLLGHHDWVRSAAFKPGRSYHGHIQQYRACLGCQSGPTQTVLHAPATPPKQASAVLASGRHAYGLTAADEDTARVLGCDVRLAACAQGHRDWVGKRLYSFDGSV